MGLRRIADLKQDSPARLQAIEDLRHRLTWFLVQNQASPTLANEVNVQGEKEPKSHHGQKTTHQLGIVGG